MKKQTKDRILCRIRMGCFIIFMPFILTACGKKKIDVTESITLQFDGCNGYGIAKIENEYAWEPEALEAAGIKQIDSLTSLSDGMTIEMAVSYEILPKENLSNGDEVIVKATFDNEAVKNYNIQFTAKERKFIVEGLPEAKKVDLFENIDVSFAGMSPNATASINNGNTDYYVMTTYKLDKDRNLRNGDMVTVTAEYNSEQLLDAGYIAENDTKEFQVSGLATYISKLDEIPNDSMEKMKKQMEDAIMDQIASRWVEKDSMTGMEFIGNYLLTLKEGMDGMWNNMLYVIYKINVSNSENDFSFYTYCRFDDLVLLEDGTCSIDLSRYTMPQGNGFLGQTSGEAFAKGQYYYLGYEQMDSLFSNCVTSHIEDYEYETNIIE